MGRIRPLTPPHTQTRALYLARADTRFCGEKLVSYCFLLFLFVTYGVPISFFIHISGMKTAV
jgi:hypothetical protein